MKNIDFSEGEAIARKYEAQAKKLRRAAKVKREKMYADALLKCLPGVAECKSSDEVDAYVAAHVLKDTSTDAPSENKPMSDDELKEFVNRALMDEGVRNALVHVASEMKSDEKNE